MSQLFPPFITGLPEADMPVNGVKAYLSQGEGHQIIFMEFTEDTVVPEHSHANQWGFVLEGRIELTIGGIKNTYVKGDRFVIGKDVKHSAKIFAGYASIEYFDQAERYKKKK
ncbi:MAG TPA: cupin domain-containing protein [Bacteroidales bacterium]|nr:cupin domain-containing protein [Bacteroidales bacterium]